MKISKMFISMIDILNQSSDVCLFLEGAIYLRAHALAIGVGTRLPTKLNKSSILHSPFFPLVNQRQ
jgi:hypothetical protein